MKILNRINKYLEEANEEEYEKYTSLKFEKKITKPFKTRIVASFKITNPKGENFLSGNFDFDKSNKTLDLLYIEYANPSGGYFNDAYKKITKFSKFFTQLFIDVRKAGDNLKINYGGTDWMQEIKDGINEANGDKK